MLGWSHTATHTGKKVGNMPDSPTITAPDERDLIVGLARTIAPMDDYDTQAENDEASVFVLLVRVARLYAADLQPGEHPDWIDVDTTLLALRENLEMDYPRPHPTVSPFSHDIRGNRIDVRL